MQTNLVKPGAVTIQSSVTKIATYTGSAVEIPLADSYAFILDVTAASGTSETMDVTIQITTDGGTTWYPAIKFTQITTAAIVKRIQIQGSLGRGEAGTEVTLANTGAAVNANTIITKKVRVVATIAGTNPSYTFAVIMLCVPRATGSY